MLCGLIIALTLVGIEAAPLFRNETGYIQYKPGTINVILAAPHGGYLTPTHIPNRDSGCWDGEKCIWRHDCGKKDKRRCKAVTVLDTYTQELINLMHEEFFKQFGGYPHTVINLLRRTKLDANRNIDEAAFGVPDAEAAWREFNAYIDGAKEAIGGPALFFDIHAHGHKKQWAELGYLFSGSDLDNNNIQPERSSIRNLYKTTGGSFDELLRGRESFGGYLQSQGYDSVPGPVHKGPGGERYFSGGYNTQRHGSRDGGVVDGIQIESPRLFRLKENRQKYAQGLAAAAHAFMKKHYDQ